MGNVDVDGTLDAVPSPSLGAVPAVVLFFNPAFFFCTNSERTGLGQPVEPEGKASGQRKPRDAHKT